MTADGCCSDASICGSSTSKCSNELEIRTGVVVATDMLAIGTVRRGVRYSPTLGVV